MVGKLKVKLLFFFLFISCRWLLLLLPLNLCKGKVGLDRRVQVFENEEARLGLDPNGREVRIAGPNLREAVDAGQDLVAESVGPDRVRMFAPRLHNQVAKGSQFRAARLEVLRLVVAPVVVQLAESGHARLRRQVVDVYRHVAGRFRFEAVEQGQGLPAGVVGPRNGQEENGEADVADEVADGSQGQEGPQFALAPVLPPVPKRFRFVKDEKVFGKYLQSAAEGGRSDVEEREDVNDKAELFVR